MIFMSDSSNIDRGELNGCRWIRFRAECICHVTTISSVVAPILARVRTVRVNVTYHLPGYYVLIMYLYYCLLVVF